MDHYKVLGIRKTATKEEIKTAFRKLAVEFHPDKHCLSPKSVQEHAINRFKQVSESYDVLIDDNKRSLYNNHHFTNTNHAYGYRTRPNNNNNNNNNNTGYGYQNYRTNRGSSVSGFEVVLRFMTTRSFLINLAFAGVLLGGSYFIDSSGKALWKMQNSGKSFEEVMESMEKSKGVKDEKM